MFKNIPKANRERLTKKQMMRVMKPDLLADSIKVEVIDDKAHKNVKNVKRV